MHSSKSPNRWRKQVRGIKRLINEVPHYTKDDIQYITTKLSKAVDKLEKDLEEKDDTGKV